MILKYMLPKSMESQITLTGDERIYYSVPIDIDESGKWSDNSFLVVTTRKVYILRESDSKVYDIKDLQKRLDDIWSGTRELMRKFAAIK